MIHPLIYQEVHMPSCRQWLEKAKSNSNHLYMRHLYQEALLCSGIHKNNFAPWYPRWTQLEKYCPLSSPSIKKIYFAIEHMPDLSRIVCGFEFQDVAYSLSSEPVSLYHETKSNMSRLSNAPVRHHVPIKCKSIIILEIFPIIRAKCFSLPDNPSFFNDLAVVLYYKVLRLGLGYVKINIVFGQYVNQSLKETTLNSWGNGMRFKITELSEIFFFFLKKKFFTHQSE